MADGKWGNRTVETFQSDSWFTINNRLAGGVSEYVVAEAYVTLPDGGRKVLVRNVHEAEAKKAVEEYWADKPAPTGYPYWAEDKPAG